MSSLQVNVVKVEGIQTHPNADRLEIANIKGWQCIVPKGQFNVGDLCVYFPIDSLLPPTLEAFLFSPDSKVKLTNHRIKTIKLRGIISQGLLVQARELLTVYREGENVARVLGITKYEPPEHLTPQSGTNRVGKWQVNPHFRKYTDIENFKNYPNLFEPTELVWVLEKIHGTNFRAGWVPTVANTWWRKLLKFMHLLPAYEFVYGSHNVQLQQGPGRVHKSLSHNVYWEAVEKHQLKTKLKPDEVVYGEIYGDGIQKGYAYDCKPGERKLVIFDLMYKGHYQNHCYVKLFCATRNLPLVPHDAVIGFGKDKCQQFVDAPSHLGQAPREGIIIKPCRERNTYMGRAILKWKNPEFELKAEDDTH